MLRGAAWAEKASDEELDAWMTKSTQDEELYVIRGRRRLAKNDPARAIEDFNAAAAIVAADRDRTAPERDLGLAHLAAGDVERGRALLNDAWNHGDVEARKILRARGLAYCTRWTPLAFGVWEGFGLPPQPRQWHVRGVSTGFSVESATVWGAQVAGAAMAYDVVGLQASVISNADRVRGLQLGLIGVAAGGYAYHPWPSYRVTTDASWGVQAAGLITIAGDFRGAQAAVVSGASEIHGLQLGVLTGARRVTGLQIGGWNLAPHRLRGVQAGAFNLAAEVRGATATGVQAGLINRAGGEFTGLQIGLLNIARRLKGVQIGAFNVIRSGAPFRFLPVINASW